MPKPANAVLQDEEGRSVLHFERVLRHPPKRVWRALTEPGELSAWYPTPFEVEPAADGGMVRYLPDGEVPDMPDGAVSEYDPPRVLAYAWGEDHLRWELRPHDGGCLLILTHTFDDRFKAARDAAGWHLCLDALSSVLDGETPRLFAHRLGRADGPESSSGTIRAPRPGDTPGMAGAQSRIRGALRYPTRQGHAAARRLTRPLSGCSLRLLRGGLAAC